MSLFCLCSAHGAPGVTTTALTLAGVWPKNRQCLLVEADPSGGVVAARFGLQDSPGLASLAAAARRLALHCGGRPRGPASASTQPHRSRRPTGGPRSGKSHRPADIDNGGPGRLFCARGYLSKIGLSRIRAPRNTSPESPFGSLRRARRRSQWHEGRARGEADDGDPGRRPRRQRGH